jgi:polyhydroxybutyrate depolymerase
MPAASTTTTSSSGSAGCSPARPHDGGNTAGTLTSGGIERTYILHVPPVYDGAQPLPLVLNFHGFSSNAREQASYSGLPALADEEGFLVVSPNGTGNPQRWSFPALGDVDEAAFVGELLDKLENELCIDASRVYAAGMSNGAAITTFIACGLPGRIAAIAAVTATAGPRLCPDDVQLPIVTFRGTDDGCVPYEGGTSACGMMLPVVAAEESVRLWGEHNGCAPGPQTADVSDNVRTTSYADCASDADVVLYTIEGGGHTWPGAVEVPRLGFTTYEIDATELIWEFFEAHPNAALDGR